MGLILLGNLTITILFLHRITSFFMIPYFIFLIQLLIISVEGIFPNNQNKKNNAYQIFDEVIILICVVQFSASNFCSFLEKFCFLNLSTLDLQTFLFLFKHLLSTASAIQIFHFLIIFWLHCLCFWSNNYDISCVIFFIIFCYSNKIKSTTDQFLNDSTFFISSFVI